MPLSCRLCLRSLGLLVWLGAASPLFAQLNNGNQWPAPKLTSLFPMGGKAGTTVEVGVTGVDVDQPESLWFSHPGIKGTANESLSTEKEPDKTPEPKGKGGGGKKGMQKAASPATKVSVVIDKDVPPGMYDVRLVNAKGISNPRVFVVGSGNDIIEKEPNNDVEQAQKIDLGTTVNGVISAPTDVDYFQLTVKKDQRVLLHVAGPSIDSRINAEIRVFDAMNRQLAYARALPYEDVLLDFTAPADGDYLLRLNQFTYTAGTADFFYRLNVFAGPWVDAVYPPVIAAGTSAQVTLFGRGLPGGAPDPKAVQDGKTLDKLTVTVTAPAETSKLDVLGSIPPYQGTMGGFEYRLGQSNPKFIAFAQAPVVVENDDNDTPEKAQKVTVPCEITGRVDKKRDRDWFAFEAKKGDVFMIEAYSQRLGAPTDLYYKLVNVAKKLDVTQQDDNPEILNPRGYFSTHRDPQAFRFAVPEDGAYQLLVGSHSADNVAGPAHVYRVRIAPERPDFQLVVLPAEDYRADSCNIGRGGTAAFIVLAQRQDGFKGEISLAIEGLPAGVLCPPQVLSGVSKQCLLAVTASDSAPERFEGVIKVTGTATIGGHKVVREARPASVTWGVQNPQQNTPTITRHDRALVFAIRNKAPLNVAPAKEKVAVIVGTKVEIPYKLSRIDPEFKGNFQVQTQPNELPTGITVNNLTFAPGKDEQTLTVTTLATLAPGNYSLVLRGFAPIAPPKGKNVNTILPTAPVTVVALPKQVATLTVDNANPEVKVGGETTLAVKVARQFDYAGEFKVQLLPENANGLTADEATIAAGQNDGKITLKIPENGAPAPRPNLTLRAIATIEGIAINHDLKINVNGATPKK